MLQILCNSFSCGFQLVSYVGNYSYICSDYIYRVGYTFQLWASVMMFSVYVLVRIKIHNHKFYLLLYINSFSCCD